MKHAITFGDLLLTLGIAGGLVIMALGVVVFLAGSMSDAPEAGDAAGRQGCITFVVGAALFIGSLWRALS